MSKTKTLCVLGGTGFVGGHLATHLSNQGHTLKVLTRHPQRHRDIGFLPRVELIKTEPLDADTLQAAFAGCDAVINLVGILHERGTSTFQAAHAELPQMIVDAMRAAGVQRLLHMSALKADAENGPSQYLKTKGVGEQVVMQAEGIATTVFRPSVIFGPNDNFYNQFAQLVQLLPVVPVACPTAKLAPVYVRDVVEAMTTALNDAATIGQSYDLCGPTTYTLKGIVEDTAWMMGVKSCVVGMPDGLARFQGKVFDVLPVKLFTTDNYLSLQVDSVSQNNGLVTLGIVPASVEGVMSMTLGQKGQRLVYDTFRQTARHDV